MRKKVLNLPNFVENLENVANFFKYLKNSVKFVK